MKQSLKNSLRLARWRLRRLQRRRPIDAAEAPALFANSFPKSGTHLLTQVLAGFTRLGPFVETGLPAITMFDGATGEARLAEELVGELNRLRPGDIGYGHLHAEPEILDALCRPGIAPYFILRDPRDVVVSHVYYVTDMAANHALTGYYLQMEDFGERLKTSILGLPEVEFDFPDVRARFLPYYGWLDRPEVLTLQFEDFLADREAVLRQVLDHAIARGFQYQGEVQMAVRILSDAINPQRSPTFRSGRSGGWQQHFTPAHKDLFKQVAGDLLIRLGYEQDHDW
jgi:hypothetical protein